MSPIASRSAFVCWKSSFWPTASHRSSPANAAARKPQPVYVASGAAISGSWMPATSMPSDQNSVTERGAEIKPVSCGHHTVVGDTWNGREPHYLLGQRRNKRRIGTPWYAARWWGSVLGYPFIQRDEKSPQSCIGNDRIARLLTDAGFSAGNVRKARQEIEADVRRIGEVVSQRICMQKRSRLHPVLVRGVHLEDSWTGVAHEAAPQPAVGFSGDRIEDHLVGEREFPLRIPSADVLTMRACGLCKAVIEKDAAPAAKPVEDAIDDRPVLSSASGLGWP